ncbi:acireductone dioxygenase [Pseudomonas sp. UBA4194]|uniref:acireductone dioxygenase n=1 Tax=Pseudomonas sp. UBA4194 TaxID=1947317 RepID=UPI0025DE9FA0|nr:acireductone dioxygenase [Pseudomonas sp. UBA4194]
MSRLTVYHQSTPDIPNKVLSHVEDIAATLAELGVTFERAESTLPVQAGASQEEVVAAYRAEVDVWMGQGGYLELDVLSIDEDHLGAVQVADGWQREHRLQGDCAICLLAGRLSVSLHVADYMYTVLCERNDRLVVPAGMPHWLDVGERPRLVALRLFADPRPLNL